MKKKKKEVAMGQTQPLGSTLIIKARKGTTGGVAPPHHQPTQLPAKTTKSHHEQKFMAHRGYPGEGPVHCNIRVRIINIGGSDHTKLRNLYYDSQTHKYDILMIQETLTTRHT